MAFPDTDLDVIVEAFLGANLNDGPGTWPSATDLSSRLLDNPISITTGRRQNQRTAAAGSCSFWLDNEDGYLTPLLASSPYYGTWDLGTPVRLSVDNVGASPPYPQFCGYVADVSVDIVPTVGGGSTSAVKVVLGGITHRLGQGSAPRSAMRRFCDPQISARVSRLAPRSHWPIDYGESSAADQAAALVGGKPLVLDYAAGSATAAWDAADLAPWLGPGLQIDGSMSLTGPAPDGATVTEAVAADVLLRNGLPSGTFGALGLRLHNVATAGGNPYVYQLIGTLSSATPTLFLYRQTIDGLTVFPFGAGTDEQAGMLWDNRLRHLRVMAVQNGSDVDVSAYIDGDLVLSGTHSSATLGVPNWQMLMTGSPQAVLGQAIIWAGAAADIPPAADVWAAAQGHPGEQAHVRFERLCAEDGIPAVTTATESLPMGPQPIADLAAMLRDGEAVDHGILSESLSTWGFNYRAGSERYNLSPSMTIDLAKYRVSKGSPPRDVLQPVRNTQRMRNEWTVNRPDGSEATARDEAHQAKHGRFNDSATVNVQMDDMVGYEAGWRVREGTVAGLRYAKVPLDLAANSAAPSDLLTDWLVVQLGDRIDRTGHGGQHPLDDVALVLEGYASTLQRKSWRVDLVAEPYEPWHVQQLTETPPDDDLLDGWFIPDWFALRAAVDDDDTSWLADCWPRMTTDADDFPCRVTVAGEESAITAVATTAATYVAVGTADHDDNAAVTPSDYAGGAVGDWVVVIAGSRDTTSPTLAVTDPNYTYDRLGTVQGGLNVWAAFRTASTPAPTVTPTGGAAGDTVSAQVFGLRGMPITGSPSDWVLDYVGKSNASAQDIAYGRLEPGGYAGRVILVVARKSDDWTSASISGLLEITETTSTSGNDQSLYAARRVDTTATEVAAGSITATGGAAAVSDSLVIALQGGYQTFTVTRSVNGVEKSHAAGDEIELLDPLVLTL